MKQRVIFLFVSCLMLLSTHAQVGHFISSDLFSSSLVSCLSQDRQGSIWVGTDYGLNRFDGYRFQTFLHDETDSLTLQSSIVVCTLCDTEGRLWVGTSQGLDRFDVPSESFVHYPFPNGICPRVNCMRQLHDGRIVVGTAGYGYFSLEPATGTMTKIPTGGAGSYLELCFEDSDNRLWLCGANGKIALREGDNETLFEATLGSVQAIIERGRQLLFICQHGVMTFSDGSFRQSNVDMSIVSGKDLIFTNVAVNSQGDIYIGSRGWGLFRIPHVQPLRLEHVDVDAYAIDASTVKVSAALFDNQGNLWLGCHRKGLLMMPQRPMQFRNWSFEAQGIRLGSTISSVCEGDGGIMWCTVQGVGVYGFDRRGRVVAHPASPDAVEFIFRDKLGHYWIGTDDGLFSYDPLSGRYESKVTFECDKFNDMTSDAQGNIYISTFARGFCVYNPQTGHLRNYSIHDNDSVLGHLSNNWVMGMQTDRQGLLWLATSAGLVCFEPATGSFRSQGWESLLTEAMCFSVCELRDGNIAVGTDRGLYLYNRQQRTIDRFPGSDELDNKVITYIVQANNGDLWCSTSMGIWQYSQQHQTFIGHIGGNGLMSREYIYGVGIHSDDDLICFGHNDGLTAFHPTDITDSQSLPGQIYLTGFRVGDQFVNSRTVINGVRITDRAVSETEEFTLSYLDHTIMLAFSQMNFDNPLNLTLEYRVNGGAWIGEPAGKNNFTLGHLQPGKYRIEVRARQATAFSPVKVVNVVIRAPWYRSTLAYIIYTLLGLSLLALALYSYRRRANRQLNEEKMKFLINATHDIRSPLTLIMNPLSNLRRHIGSEQKEAQRDVDTIEHNAQRILNLVNQILDVRKIDKQQMQLHCRKTDLVPFINGIVKMFEYNAQERNITFQFNHEGLTTLEAWVDPNQFDKVITNLLTNAFKYSNDGGTISVNLSSTAEGSARIEVADTGVGLDNDSLKHIFDRFYQGGNSRRLHIDGTGIGLNLCKMIVDMHQGTISAQNRTDRQGALFIVELPLGKDHLSPEQIDDTPAPVPTAAPEGKGNSSSRHKVLIVDDDLEIGRYIQSELGNYYKFGICTNGKEAMRELLTSSDYELVISDVMMPEMDGFTMLRMIKTNLNLSHLPVIMLTSKADVGNRLEGLERGADAFLAKPFNMEELRATIGNLIQSRQRLKGKYSGAQRQVDKLDVIDVKGNDEQLMERIMKVVNKYLSDSDFNVEQLTQEVGISRAQLHRKMKEMTGLTTSEFIRNIRLEQAARLLKEQKINITQVAYTVGFSNLAHFSTLFRRHFGVSPSDYAEQKG